LPTPAWYPNDPGTARRSGGWEKLQWNFLAGFGINAPQAWANLIADHWPGAKGVVIAVLDTGIAYRNWKTFMKMPDFGGTRFVDPCDLVAGKIVNGVCTNPDALDREGHGTFIAGEIAEATNNKFGLTGLAYGASIMPVRVLDANGNGYASTIAQGILYAVQHHASVINLSLEFSVGVTATEIPEIVAAISYAHRHNVVVVAAAGNDSSNQIAYPAVAPGVISVGATTLDGCLANYSNVGSGLDLVAPGGGTDTGALSDPDCQPTRNQPGVFQMTFNDPTRPDAFGFPSGWYGTSMSAAEVAAAAAMVIASRVLGAHPTPDQILARLEQTATPLGGAGPNSDFGYGLLNIGAATAPTRGTATRQGPRVRS
jgi:serine protease